VVLRQHAAADAGAQHALQKGVQPQVGPHQRLAPHLAQAAGQRVEHRRVLVHQAAQQRGEALVLGQVAGRGGGDEGGEGVVVGLVDALDVGVGDDYMGQQLQIEQTPGEALGQLRVGEARAGQDLAGVEPRIAPRLQHVVQGEFGERLIGILQRWRSRRVSLVSG
jgi:hypothetical protein